MSAQVLLLAAACTTSLDSRQGVDALGAGGDSAAGLALVATPMRRLTHSEYNHSVQALLGTARSPADDFPADPTADGFDNSGEVQVLGSADLEAQFLAATQLADEATAEATLSRTAPCADGQPASACLEAFVRDFGLRAWRRPLADDDVKGLLALAQGLPNTTYGQQVAGLITTFLISPRFIFLSDPGNTLDPGRAQRRSAWALASQLSYFLWSAPPDAPLFAAAADGSLTEDGPLGEQVARMLADPRAAAMVDDFAGQWMQLRSVATFTPDPTAFPRWSPRLRDLMLGQSRMTLADFVRGDVSLPTLFTGTSTYLNADLAAYYDLPKVASDGLVSVPLAANTRRGLLGQGAILANMSFPQRTSLTRRGEFILDQLLCAPVPPPPANVPALKTDGPAVGSQRTIMAAHATDPACSVCHRNLDPYGYVLESFDAVGASRTLDHGYAIDTNATLPDGAQVAHVEELEAHLAGDPRLGQCAVEKLYIYALGRSVGDDDQAQLATLSQGFVAGGQLLPPLVTQLVLSESFRSRRSP